MRVRFALIGLTLAACAATQASADTASACFPDRETILALDFEAFDQNADSGWRIVADNNPACELAAADLIAEYRQRRTGDTSTARYQDTLINHEGQLRAANGQTKRALTLFREVLAIHTAESGGTDDTNTLRDKAIIAFLEGDQAALFAARDELALLPMPEGMAEAMEQASARSGRQIKLEWPLNLAFTNNLVKCFGRSWRETTRDNCPDLTE
jgi:hypothetical protein